MAYKRLCSVSICLKHATHGAYCKQCATEIMEGRDPKALICSQAVEWHRAQHAQAQQMLDDVQDVDFSE